MRLHRWSALYDCHQSTLPPAAFAIGSRLLFGASQCRPHRLLPPLLRVALLALLSLQLLEGGALGVQLALLQLLLAPFVEGALLALRMAQALAIGQLLLDGRLQFEGAQSLGGALGQGGRVNRGVLAADEGVRTASEITRITLCGIMDFVLIEI